VLLESLLSPIFAVVAILYAAVGQAGGTGYIAVMGLIGFTPDVIKPTALALNILVAAIGCARLYRAGLLTWRSCYPFPVLGPPFSSSAGCWPRRLNKNHALRNHLGAGLSWE
jgi:uncharacterized membrane protein YfcA